MRSPTYFTKFLSCIDGSHSDCQHSDSAGEVVWVCQCECHPRELAGDDNNYALFDILPEAIQRALRYAGAQDNGVPVGLNVCGRCREYRGQCLQDQNPLRWHLGVMRVKCGCES